MASNLAFTATLLLSSSLLQLSSAVQIFNGFIFPNFTVTVLQFVDSNGVFLASPNGIFQASFYNPPSQQSSYLSVLHVASNTIVWSANRNSPIRYSGTVSLTPNGISIHYDNGSLSWTTPPLKAAVVALQLLNNGNLILLDKSNMTIWQSFDYPTDTILMNQSLSKGKVLASAVSDLDFSTGQYQFYVTSGDAVLQWGAQVYWKLSMDEQAFKLYNPDVSYMKMNQSGLYLFSENGTNVVWQVNLPLQNFSMAKLDSKGRFRIISFSGDGKSNLEYSAPNNECDLPVSCGRLGLCRSNSSDCFCPSGFRSSGDPDIACLPSDGNNLPRSTCNSNVSFSYLGLGRNVHYFANNFIAPVSFGGDFFTCEYLCSRNCSCLGFFYMNSTASCYLLKDPLGSFTSVRSKDEGRLGYIKTVTSIQKVGGSVHNSKRKFPVFGFILVPFAGFFLSTILLMICLLRRKGSRTSTAVVKLGRQNSLVSEVFNTFPIPGLPSMFKYEELEEATDHFKTVIGSGGFGTVYKGTLPDKTPVAIKRINNLGVRGRKEFCTEIAIIGNTRHANLVKLRGFCAQGPQRALVLEYMSRGSLDQALFTTTGPVLEWQERVDIALQAARGLAYLHGECENKIIHLDIKPENILLDDRAQIKISDFGLSKLISPEQSSIFTMMRGTCGYLAPEWLMNSSLNDKFDVYSYGMVLLEIVSGRRNSSPHLQSGHTDNRTSDDKLSSSVSRSLYFPLLALEMHQQGQYLKLLDPRLDGTVAGEEVERLVRIALCCVQLQPMLRPSMANVVAMLEGRKALCKPIPESLNFLKFYGKHFKEPEIELVYGGDESLRQIAACSLTTSTSSTGT